MFGNCLVGKTMVAKLLFLIKIPFAEGLWCGADEVIPAPSIKYAQGQRRRRRTKEPYGLFRAKNMRNKFAPLVEI